FGAECSRTVAEHGEREAGGAIGGDFRTVEFPAQAIDDANGKLDHSAAGDLKRHLRIDGEGLQGFDVADAGAERGVTAEAVGQHARLRAQRQRIHRSGLQEELRSRSRTSRPLSGRSRTRSSARTWPMRAPAAGTRPSAAAAALTISLTVPTGSRRSCRTLLLNATCKPVAVSVWKPGNDALTWYVP